MVFTEIRTNPVIELVDEAMNALLDGLICEDKSLIVKAALEIIGNSPPSDCFGQTFIELQTGE